MKMGIMMMIDIVVLGAAFVSCAVVITGQVTVVPDEENTAHKCDSCDGFSHNCAECDAGRCCSPAHYCGSTDPYCKPCGSLNICDCYPEYCKPPVGQAQRLEDTSSSKPRYSNNDNGTDHNNTIIATYDRNFTSTASSLTTQDNMLLAWRSNYGRATIFCDSSSSVSKHHDHDGQCLKVTSSENGKQAVVRVIVQNQYCASNPSLVLDYDVFQQLHNNGGDAKQDDHQLLVSYTYVHCMDY